MIDYLIQFLQWLNTFSWQTWVIIFLSLLLIGAIIVIRWMAQGFAEIVKVFWR